MMQPHLQSDCILQPFLDIFRSHTPKTVTWCEYQKGITWKHWAAIIYIEEWHQSMWGKTAPNHLKYATKIISKLHLLKDCRLPGNIKPSTARLKSSWELQDLIQLYEQVKTEASQISRVTRHPAMRKQESGQLYMPIKYLKNERDKNSWSITFGVSNVIKA